MDCPCDASCANKLDTCEMTSANPNSRASHRSQFLQFIHIAWIVWQWRDVVQVWWTISAPRLGLRCTAPFSRLRPLDNPPGVCAVGKPPIADRHPSTPAPTCLVRLVLSATLRRLWTTCSSLSRQIGNQQSRTPTRVVVASCCTFSKASRNILASGLLSSPNASTAVCKRTTCS